MKTTKRLSLAGSILLICAIALTGCESVYSGKKAEAESEGYWKRQEQHDQDREQTLDDRDLGSGADKETLEPPK